MIKGPGTFARKPLAICVASALLALSSSQANAVSFDVGDFEVSFDSTFSLGASWRVEDREIGLIGKTNVPGQFNLTGYHPALNPIYTSGDIWAQPGSYSNNGDAGNLNFDSGETFSKIFKGTHELDIRKDNWGFFTRFMYFYDFELMDGKRPYRNNTSGTPVDPCRDEQAKDLTCRDIRLLDAFLYADFDFNDGMNPVSVRIGDQVVSWGESTLISHGLNVNPVDIARLRAPGAEVKEAFIPVGMVWSSIGITDNVSVEMFYQYDWQETVLPTPGSYFSTNDFAGEGGYRNNVNLGFTSNPDMDLERVIGGLNSLYSDWQTAVAAQGITDPVAQQQLLANMYLAYPTKVALRPPNSTRIPTASGRDVRGINEPSDSGQYGLKLAIYSPELNDTEFGLYYMNYHSRRPVISGVTSDFFQESIQSDLAYIAQNQISIDNVYSLTAFSKAALEYVEDIKLYGFSFNTTVGDTAVSGEISYRQDEPLQIDDVEILYAGMPEQLAAAGLRPEFTNISQLDTPPPGEYSQGFILSDTTQAQVTFTHLMGPTLGTDNLVLLAEVGGININDMPDPDELRLNGPGTARSGPLPGKEGLLTAIQNGPETNPFPSKFAWGYRLVARAEYNNVFAGINVLPRVTFSHDVNGITPDPLFLFVEDRKSAAFTVTFDYQSRISADITYNAFWGGEGNTNNFRDRDYISFNVKYAI